MSEPTTSEILETEAPPMRWAERMISYTLRGGVGLSVVIILVGTVMSFVHHPEYVSSPVALARLTRPGAAVPHSLQGVFSGIADLRGQALVALGLLALIATPVTRVAVSIVAFLRMRDRGYVVITSAVLALLILSFFLGSV